MGLPTLSGAHPESFVNTAMGQMAVYLLYTLYYSNPYSLHPKYTRLQHSRLVTADRRGYTALQHSTALYSTLQHSTALQHSTVYSVYNTPQLSDHRALNVNRGGQEDAALPFGEREPAPK